MKKVYLIAVLFALIAGFATYMFAKQIDEKTFMIRGKVNGKIDSTSDLVIDSDAVVNADITAERVLIRGKVKGNVIGNKLIFITASGSLDGDITTGKVVLEPGCIFTGKCSMVRNENEK